MNINNAVETLRNLDVVKENNIKVTFHPKGETSNGDESLHCFIRETNKKYFEKIIENIQKIIIHQI